MTRSIHVTWMGTSGNGRLHRMQTADSSTEQTVLTRKMPPTRVMLLTTRRPWYSTSGRAASLPVPMAMLQSACRSAGRSFTPSPVMATQWPCRCSAWTSCFFCAGETRPKMEWVCAALSMSASLVTPVMSR